MESLGGAIFVWKVTRDSVALLICFRLRLWQVWHWHKVHSKNANRASVWNGCIASYQTIHDIKYSCKDGNDTCHNTVNYKMFMCN